MKESEICRNCFLLKKPSLLFTQGMKKRSNLRWEETARFYGGARSPAPVSLVVAAHAGCVRPAQPHRPHRRCRTRAALLIRLPPDGLCSTRSPAACLLVRLPRCFPIAPAHGRGLGGACLRAAEHAALHLPHRL